MHQDEWRVMKKMASPGLGRLWVEVGCNIVQEEGQVVSACAEITEREKEQWVKCPSPKPGHTWCPSGRLAINGPTHAVNRESALMNSRVRCTNEPLGGALQDRKRNSSQVRWRLRFRELQLAIAIANSSQKRQRSQTRSLKKPIS